MISYLVAFVICCTCLRVQTMRLVPGGTLMRTADEYAYEDDCGDLEDGVGGRPDCNQRAADLQALKAIENLSAQSGQQEVSDGRATVPERAQALESRAWSVLREEFEDSSVLQEAGSFDHHRGLPHGLDKPGSPPEAQHRLMAPLDCPHCGGSLVQYGQQSSVPPKSWLLKRPRLGCFKWIKAQKFAHPKVYNFTVQATKEFMEMSPGGRLQKNDLCAVMAYTHQDNKLATQFHIKLNLALREETMMEVSKMYGAFMYHMITALRKLESFKGTCYRGVKTFTFEEYAQVGSLIEWRAFSSSTTVFNVAEQFLRGQADSAIFVITSLTAKNIWEYSQFPKEREVLFQAGTRFNVTQVPRYIKSKKYYLIYITEVSREDAKKLAIANPIQKDATPTGKAKPKGGPKRKKGRGPAARNGARPRARGKHARVRGRARSHAKARAARAGSKKRGRQGRGKRKR